MDLSIPYLKGRPNLHITANNIAEAEFDDSCQRLDMILGSYLCCPLTLSNESMQ